MTDREKVIKGLAEISEYVRARADIAGIGKGKEVFDSWYRAVEDAIVLLREPEPVPVEVYEIDEWHCRDVASPDRVAEWIASASNTPYYCPNCWRRVFWEVDADGRT